MGCSASWRRIAANPWHQYRPKYEPISLLALSHTREICRVPPDRHSTLF